MKKLSIFILVLNFSFSSAQISDTDAKIMYQQAEDLYNQNKFYDASQKTLQLKERMGNWTPKVLYLRLKSVNSSFVEKDNSALSYSKTKKQFSELNDECDIFFKIVDSKTYPGEKYKDIQNIQIYFQKSMKEYDVPIENTTNFLSFCLNRFATASSYSTENALTIRNSYSNGNTYYFDIKGSLTLEFVLRSNILYMVAFGEDRFSTNRNYEKTMYKVDRIDLSKITSIDENGLLIGAMEYNSKNEKIPSFFRSGWGDIGIEYKKNSSTEVKKDYDNRDLERKKSLKEGKYENFCCQYASGPTVNVFRYFKTDSAMFRDENFKSKIIEAFRNLIDYVNHK